MKSMLTSIRLIYIEFPGCANVEVYDHLFTRHCFHHHIVYITLYFSNYISQTTNTYLLSLVSSGFRRIKNSIYDVYCIISATRTFFFGLSHSAVGRGDG